MTSSVMMPARNRDDGRVVAGELAREKSLCIISSQRRIVDMERGTWRSGRGYRRSKCQLRMVPRGNILRTANSQIQDVGREAQNGEQKELCSLYSSWRQA